MVKITGTSTNHKLEFTSAADQLLRFASYNILDGGLGADTTTGSIGDDTYVVENKSDKLVDQSNQGPNLVGLRSAGTSSPISKT